MKKSGRVIGIEILDMSKYLSSDELGIVKFGVSRAIAHRQSSESYLTKYPSTDDYRLLDYQTKKNEE